MAPVQVAVLTQRPELATFSYPSARTWVRHRLRDLGWLDLPVLSRVEDKGKIVEASYYTSGSREGDFGQLTLRSLGRVPGLGDALQKLIDNALKKGRWDERKVMSGFESLEGETSCLVSSVNFRIIGGDRGDREIFSVCDVGSGRAVLLHFTTHEVLHKPDLVANVESIVRSYAPPPN